MGWGWLAATMLARVYLVFVLALAACALLPMVAGLSGSVVQSGSMQPHIHAGDVVLSRALPKDAPVPLGRVVTFPAPAGSAQSGTRLHRIIAVDPDGSLVTAGDANAQADSAPLKRADIIATACVLVPWIGLPALWLTHGSFLPLAVWLLLTSGAMAIEFTRVLSTPRRRNRLRPPRAPHRSDAGDRPLAQPRLRRLSKIVVGPLIVVMLAIVTGTAVIAAPTFGQAEAAFTGTTTSVGNSWAMSAAATAVKLGFITNPSGSTGGVAFATQPIVALQDVSGHATAVPGAVTLEITTPAGATLACAANPVNAISGLATFSGCSIDKVGTYTLTARSGALTAAVSTSIVIARGPASQLRFTTSPSVTTVFNTTFTTQPVVTVQDAGGNTITSTAAVALSLTTPGGATLSCTTNPRAAVSGVATFSGCKVNKPGSYTLTATSGALSPGVSASFTIASGPATKVVFTTGPSSSVSATAFATQPVVTVQDASGNTVTASTAAVTLSLTTPGGATLACTTNPNSASSGVVTFSGCKVDKAGTYTLKAASGSLTTATSASFAITTGAAEKLVVTTSPSSSVSATTFTAQPGVTVQDAGGNTVTISTAAVTLSLTTPGGATLTCTTNPKAAVSGVATFSGCKVDKTGTYTLTATSGTLASGVSASFTITPGIATRLVFTTSPSDAASDTVFAIQPVVAVQDASGNTVTTYNSLITLFVTGIPGGVTLTCAVNPKTPVSGVATYAGCRINKKGTYTLSAFSGLSGTSDSFAIGGG